MMHLSGCCFLLTIVAIVSGFDKSPTERVDAAATKLLAAISSDAKIRKAWEERVEMWSNQAQALSKNIPPLPTYSLKSEKVPSSVHELRPGDIQVVAALGDSITAANGASATSVLGVATEFRGRSWCIGGDLSLSQGVGTIPNILRQINPNVVGYSVGEGDVESSGARLNVAEPGNVAYDMPRQARNLVQRLSTRQDVDMENDWKLITLFIGGNDLCRYCNDKDFYSPDSYANNIKEALDILQRDVPRAFVSVVSILDITPLADLTADIICAVVQGLACDCAFDNDAGIAELRQTQKQYNKNIEDIINSGIYDDSDDFTVVFQEFFKDTLPPTLPNGEADISYFAPDCFHFSEKGHYLAATTLWNQMFEPVGSKRTSWTQGETVQYPNGYFATNINSRRKGALAQFTVNNKQPTDGAPSMTVYIIGGVIGGMVALAVMALVAVVIVRQRRMPAQLPSHTDSRVNIASVIQ